MKNRLKIYLLLAGLFLYTFSVTAQVTLSVRNQPVRQIIQQVERASGYSFFFNNELPDLTKTVSLKVENASIEKTLNELFKDTRIAYELKGEKQVVLSEKTENETAEQKNVLSGIVTDNSGEPMPGVSIVIKGKNTGTITDLDGNFILPVNDNKDVLVVSYIGFVTQEVVVGAKREFRIRLQEDNKLLDEVVVVGYAVQKKVNLTGSVSAVGSDVLETRPIANASTGLQGALPGVTIVNSTGRPGDNNVSIKIRGVGTLNNSNPLILIDGIEGNLNTLNPDDIESVSALKDAASSAIYGSRAANGVILVTTKKANREMKPTINYSGYYAFQSPVTKPNMLDAVEYLEMLKEATSNVNKNWGYTQDDIDAVIDGSNPNYRANTNWINEVYRDYAPQMAHNVSINGGSKTMGYYMSYGNLSTEGLAVGDGYQSARNNVRLKVNSEFLDRINIEGNIGYNDVDNWTPRSSDSSDNGIFYQALRSSPLTPVRFDDGQWGYGGSSANPLAAASDAGYINYKSQETTVNFSGDVKIIEGLTAKVQYGTRLLNVLRKNQSNIVQHFYPGTEKHLAYTSNTSYLSQRDVAQRYQNLTAQIDYDKTIEKHSFHVLAGFSQEWQHYEQWEARRDDLVSNSLPVLNAGTGTQTNSGYANHWALRSGFGRVNYNYGDRYLAEVNLRYDLSSKFHKDHRGGYFPSASVAWRLSEESFMKSFDWLSNAKIRLSYGTLGNQYTNNSSDLYPYLSMIEASTSGMPIGNKPIITSSMQQLVASNKLITWESVQMSNIGLDLAFFNGRLSFTGDYFIKNTNDILLKVNLPDVIGVTEPYQNAGKVKNQGWEITLGWQDKIGKDFKYGLTFNLSDVKNEVVSMGSLADDFSGDQIRAVGYPIDAFWGYEAIGLAGIDEFDYNPGTNTYSNPKFPYIAEYASKLGPGDIKYKNQNPDEDDVITKEKDRVYLGSAIPRYTYSFSGNAGWKGIDFQFLIQGVGKCDGLVTGIGRHAFTELANYPQEAHRDRWTFENPNPNASYPRFTYDEKHNQDNLSSFWIEDASYIRLKNIQLGYTLPEDITKKIRVDKCRLYVSGENLLTITKFFDSYDPEVPISKGGYYPVVKTVSLGLSLTLR